MAQFAVETVQMDSDDGVILRPRGSITSSTTPELQARLDEVIGKKRYRIILDLSETDFISSSGIGLFLGTVSNLRVKGGDLILMKVPKQIEDIFDIINIKSYFPIINNLDELKTLSRPE